MICHDAKDENPLSERKKKKDSSMFDRKNTEMKTKKE